MTNVISLDEARPHMTGNAMCLQCGEKWVAVAPIGTVELECPECQTWKGVFEGMTAPDTVWQCDCGNQHFYIDDNGAMCAKCGVRQ
jgi:hypothetical protein